MKKIYSLISISLVLITCHLSASAQWTRLTRVYPDMYRMADVAVRDSVIIGVGYRFSDFQGYIFQSFNNGVAWDSVSPLPAGYLIETVAFKDADTAIAAGFGSHTILFRSMDKGHNWAFYLEDTVTAGIADMQFLNSKVGFAGGYDTPQFFSGNCYYTNDGGNSWITQTNTAHTCLDSLGLDHIDFVDAQTGYAVSNFALHKYLLKTTDTGKHWNIIYAQEGIGGVYFWNVLNGVMVADSGKIFKTSNGGLTWTPKISPVGDPLFSVSFANDKLGYAVGVYGRILKTTDGGETWTIEVSPTSETLLKVRWFNGSAYAVGDGGTILRSGSVLDVRSLPVKYQLNIYPNPASSILNISSTVSQHFDMLSATLVDMSGHVVRAAKTEKTLMQMDIHDLAAGIYTVIINAGGQAYSEQVTIGH